jgi:2-iminobutanoate/2-iminopropanoate deaminase
MMEAELSNPTQMNAPVGAYSHVARVPLQGADLLVISGQLAANLDNDDIVAQADEAFDQLRLAVESFGGSMRDIIKLTTFVTRLERREEMRALRVKYFGDRFPASTLVQIVALADPRALVEIEALAVIRNQG